MGNGVRHTNIRTSKDVPIEGCYGAGVGTSYQIGGFSRNLISIGPIWRGKITGNNWK